MSVAAVSLVVGLAGVGCASAPPEIELRERAALCLHRGMRFPGNPAVRAQSMEAAAEVLDGDAAGLIAEGLRDEHAGVRFAACMALGRIQDHGSTDAIRNLVGDPDASVRVAAFYALERLGEFSYRQAWADALQNAPDAGVRRNAAMTLGLLGNPKVAPLLKRSVAEDNDDGVRLQAVEALALLGDPDAQARFVRDAFGGIGYRQPFALLALGRVRDEESISVLQTRMVNAPYLEAKLAAARGLAMHGRLDGFDLAMQSLTWAAPDASLPDDPPENQIMRVRSMAAMTLGDMRDRRALPALYRCMEMSDDPRIQVAAARSILRLLGPAEPRAPASAAPGSTPHQSGAAPM
ncbi:MAG: HEAT repeat domain-containing protein [Planctomycetes bacterium]|nr:HEAT repeat domain-containing protein [Planctomycetota bacterium]